ncbi:MAG TPA: ATP-binding protein [Cytophagales bacterium]|nr:ATP-binding protein [Cytophagales bacterium]
MTRQELTLLVSKGEGLYLEFKKKVDHPEKIVKEIVAFVNASGGRLLIGVDDDGTISGLKNAEEEAFELEKTIIKLCRPSIKYSLEKIPLNEKKQILVYSFKESRKKPHYVIQDLKTGLGKAYFRVEDRSIQASKELRQILKGRRFKRRIKFEFSAKERILMQYLDQKEKITVKEFMEIASISYKLASSTLIALVLSNVLIIRPDEKEDYYLIKDH